MMPFRWVGWFDGSSDCEPPEPEKHWIEIYDGDEEFCVIVYRTDNFDQTSNAVIEREVRAANIVAALNRYYYSEEAE